MGHGYVNAQDGRGRLPRHRPCPLPTDRTGQMFLLPRDPYACCLSMQRFRCAAPRRFGLNVPERTSHQPRGWVSVTPAKSPRHSSGWQARDDQHFVLRLRAPPSCSVFVPRLRAPIPHTNHSRPIDELARPPSGLAPPGMISLEPGARGWPRGPGIGRHGPGPEKKAKLTSRMRLVTVHFQSSVDVANAISRIE